jgi:hypothetical protein
MVGGMAWAGAPRSGPQCNQSRAQNRRGGPQRRRGQVREKKPQGARRDPFSYGRCERSWEFSSFRRH